MSGLTFMVDSSVGWEKKMTILSDDGDLLRVQLSTKSPFGVDESEEELPRSVFDTCLRTGYIREIKPQWASV